MERTPHVVVFGATSAIAEACARIWAGRGARLHLVGRDAAKLEAIAADLTVRGAGEVRILAMDLAQAAEFGPALARIVDAFGPPDVALIAWGTLTDQARAEGDPAYLVQELGNNFVAPAALLAGLARIMAERGSGVLACITSVAGLRGRASNFVYGSAKGGLQRFLEGLRHRLHGTGVAVLDIRPGFVKTAMTAHLPQGGPLWAESAQVASDILRAIDRKKAVLYTPWFWRFVMLVIRSLPQAVIHRTKL